MITKRQKYLMYIYLIRALFLGIGTSLVLATAKRDAWIGTIIGSLIGLIFVLIIQYILKHKKDKSIFEVLTDMKLVGKIVRVLFVILAIHVIIQCIVTIDTYTSGFFLLKTPQWLLSLSVISTALYIVSKGLDTTFRVGEIFFPLSIILFLIPTISLFGFINLDNILPLFTENIESLTKSAFYFATFSSAPLLFTLQLDDDGKGLVPTYIIGTSILFIVIFVCSSVLGPDLGSIYRFPEYVILKKISLLNFIEKIENIISLFWVIDGIILIVFCSHFIKSSLPKKEKNIIFYGIYLIIFIITAFVFGNIYFFDVELYNYSSYIISTLSILIAFPLLLYIRKKKKVSNI